MNRNSIRSKVFIAMIVGGLMPIVIILLTVGIYDRKRIVHNELAKMQLLAKELSRQVEMAMSRAARELNTLPQNERLIGVGNGPEPERLTELQRLARLHTVFTEISLYDKSGYVVESTSPDSDAQESTTWFRAALQGQSCLSRPMASPTREGLRFSVYLPVPEAFQSDVRVIKATLLFGEIHTLFRELELARGEQLIILDKYGNQVAGQGPISTLAKFDAAVPVSYWRAEPEGEYMSPEDERYFYASHLIIPSGLLANDSLVFLWLKPAKQVLAVADRALVYPLVAAGVTILLAYLLSSSVSRRLSLPFAQAGEVALAVSKGSLDERLPCGGSQEMQQLASAFNGMLDTIKSDQAALRESSDELIRANQELAHTSKLKDEFLAGMSHELRTPLNAVLGHSQALLEGIHGDLSSEQFRSVEAIENSSQQLLALINDILDIGIIGSGDMQLKFENTDIRELCAAALGLFTRAAQEKRLRISTDIDADVKEMRGDARRLKQILVKLLSNAVKFTPPGGDIGIRVKRLSSDDLLEFCVWDTGIGIDASLIPLLFERFVQVDSRLSREADGAGLGLALVQHLTELHGGSVVVESKVGHGSEFFVRIPLRDGNRMAPLPSNEDRKRAGSTSEGISGANAAKSPVVLLVEDNESNITIIREYLKAHGHAITVARNGLEGIQCARDCEPDLIFMDIQMPKMDGIEATRRIRKDPKTASVPIIALTALAMPGDQERFFAAGMTGYMSKPVQLKEVLAVVRQAADGDVEGAGIGEALSGARL